MPQIGVQSSQGGDTSFLERSACVRTYVLYGIAFSFPCGGGGGGPINPTPLLMTIGVVHRINPRAQSHAPFRLFLRHVLRLEIPSTAPPPLSYPVYVTASDFLEENNRDLSIRLNFPTINIYVSLLDKPKNH